MISSTDSCGTKAYGIPEEKEQRGFGQEEGCVAGCGILSVFCLSFCLPSGVALLVWIDSLPEIHVGGQFRVVLRLAVSRSFHLYLTARTWESFCTALDSCPLFSSLIFVLSTCSSQVCALPSFLPSFLPTLLHFLFFAPSFFGNE